MGAIFVCVLLILVPLIVAALGGSVLWVVITGIACILAVLGIAAYVADS